MRRPHPVHTALLGLIAGALLFHGLGSPAVAQAPAASQACAAFELPYFTMNTKSGNWLSYGRREVINPGTDGYVLPVGWAAVGGSADAKDGFVVACR